ncbi:MAG: GNAT family N-acetyltransferase [Vulcanimicrobiaceae bacterium]
MRVAIEPLDTAGHNRAAFSCGQPGVDTYFRQVAAQASKALHAQTYVLVDADETATLKKVLGFYTLTPHEYRDDEMDPVTARALKLKSLRRIPAILLGQMGVSINQQGKGLGRLLLDHAFRKTLFASYCVGGALLVTDPIDFKARTFYEKYDFRQLPNGGARLYMAVSTLARAYPAVVAAARASVA